jgi:hypothetical protein
MANQIDSLQKQRKKEKGTLGSTPFNQKTNKNEGSFTLMFSFHSNF